MATTLLHRYIAAADGGKLSCYTVGDGPNLLILHGAVTFALTHRDLALALSSRFTVHVASRRGRGLSSQYPLSVTSMPALFASTTSIPNDASSILVGGELYPRTYATSFTAAVLATEVSDLEALIAATNAEYLLCVSSGALVLLHALRSPDAKGVGSLKRMIIFEPPIFFCDRPSAVDYTGLRRFEVESIAGDTAGAMVTAMRLVQLGPAWIPHWLMKTLTGFMFRFQDSQVEKRRAAGEADEGVCTMQALGKLLRYDFALAEGMVCNADAYKPLGKGAGSKILFLTGSNSPLYLAQGIATLAGTISGAEKVVVNGAGHELLCGSDMRGNPQRAVPAILTFFLEH